MEEKLSDLEIVILGNFNVLLLRRRIMSSGNAGGWGLSILLVVLMVLPSFLGIATLGGQSEICQVIDRLLIYIQILSVIH